MDMIEKVKWIEEEIMDEIQGAKNYMNCAKAWAEKDPDISKTFNRMASQEMEHANHLNQIVTRILSTHMNEMEYKKLPDLMMQINMDQINLAKAYVPEVPPEPVTRTTPTK